jgi:pyridoxal phosphate enzyme (YggS family)
MVTNTHLCICLFCHFLFD